MISINALSCAPHKLGEPAQLDLKASYFISKKLEVARILFHIQGLIFCWDENIWLKPEVVQSVM